MMAVVPAAMMPTFGVVASFFPVCLYVRVGLTLTRSVLAPTG